MQSTQEKILTKAIPTECDGHPRQELPPLADDRVVHSFLGGMLDPHERDRILAISDPKAQADAVIESLERKFVGL